MFYKFPVIEHLSDLQPYIEECTSIKLARKEDYYVVNYLVADKEAFPDISEGNVARWRRECRGIIFDLNGKILRRPFHKFFNLGEREELSIDKIDWNVPHIILDKVDGSMVTPLTSFGELRFATKAGCTDTSNLVEAYVDRTPFKEYRNLCLVLGDLGKTPIFEYISRQNRIVIDYRDEDMLLLAVRDNKTGEYLDWEPQCKIAERYNVPVVKAIHNSKSSIDAFVKHIYTQKDIEGVVVRFNNGHMIKIKTEWYVNIHRAKDACLHEKRVLAMILDDKLDDVIPFLLKEDADRLIAYRDKFWEGLNETMTETIKRLELLHFTGTTKKDYALNHASLHNPIINAITFRCWDKIGDIHEVLKETVKKNLGSQSTVDKVRFIWGDAKWSFSLLEDVG